MDTEYDVGRHRQPDVSKKSLPFWKFEVVYSALKDKCLLPKHINT